MARIPEAEIERLKREVSLERLVEAKGVELKKQGADLVGLCPFHDDRTPSLVITVDKNLWHCLGACQAGGSVIDWVMKAEGMSFRAACELLREGVPSLVPFAEKRPSRPSRPSRQAGAVPKKSTVVKLRPIASRNTEDAALLRQVVDYYHDTLKESPEALAYLEKRGLKSSEAIERFRLGYANRTLGYRLPQKNRKTGAELRGQLERLGILRESGHEHFRGSLVVPIFDEEGGVAELYGRKISNDLRPGTPLHLYLRGEHAGVWNIEAFRGSKEIIVCEALLDALTFWCAGFRNVTASYGVNGFTRAHWAALARHDIERVYLAYDRDKAGDEAAAKLGAELIEQGLEVYRVLFPKGMDANEYALKVQPAERSLGMALRQAEWMGGVRRESAVGGREQVSLVSDEHEAAVDHDEALAQAGQREEGAVIEPPELTEPPVFSATTPPSSLLAATVAPGDVSESEMPSAPRSREGAGVSEPPGTQAAKALAPKRGTVEQQGDEVTFRFGPRRWRIRGMQKQSTPGALKVNLLVSREGGGFHVDQLDLYAARQRAAYLKEAAAELSVEEDVLKRDLGAVILELERLEEEQLKEAKASESLTVELSEAEQKAALELLRDANLLDRILEDFELCGVVGEETNKLTSYLAATSRKLAEPLAIVIQSSSAAGKSSLMDAVLEMMPKEERVQYSAMTGQSLFYMSEMDLRHKILAIVEEEGAERASYALKLLQSEGELTIASTGKDPATGRLITQEYHVEGPVMLFQTTTAVDMDEELLNRCIVLTVDEGREQTKAIHERQRKARTLEGVIAREERRRLLHLHQNAQRLLRPLFVVNPYANELRFPDHQTRTRRDHTKYLGLIEAVTLLHQYQRPEKTAEERGQRFSYIEVTREDIEVANRLAHEVLGRSLDELPPQTRRLLGLLDEIVTAECKKLGLERRDFRFSRREVRERTGWSYEQLRVHLGRLAEFEYLLVHRGARGQSFVYELAYDGGGANGGSFLVGLIDVAELAVRAAATGTTRALGGGGESLGGQKAEFGVAYRAHTGPIPGGGGAGETSEREPKTSGNPEIGTSRVEKPHRGNGEARRVVPLAAVSGALAVARVS